MKTYIIDYTRPDGRRSFSTVHCDSEAEAIRIFQSRGIDGWSGYNYSQYKIDKIAER